METDHEGVRAKCSNCCGRPRGKLPQRRNQADSIMLAIMDSGDNLCPSDVSNVDTTTEPVRHRAGGYNIICNLQFHLLKPKEDNE